jgi:hypothetical protein
LVEELVYHGVGRTVAARYAREKPEACRRCLEYLPHARFKTTKGAWLANAIRDEYGPPRGYTEEQARLAQERQAEEGRLARKARQKHGLAIREEKTVRLRAAYRQLEKTGGEALRAFHEYVERERARTDRIAAGLSARRREELFAAFDRPERRLQLFEAWANAGCGVPVPQTAAPEESHPPGGP